MASDSAGPAHLGYSSQPARDTAVLALFSCPLCISTTAPLLALDGQIEEAKVSTRVLFSSSVLRARAYPHIGR
jgi:hypothetical protein